VNKKKKKKRGSSKQLSRACVNACDKTQLLIQPFDHTHINKDVYEH
jgi:ribosome recycling factor